MLKFNTLLDLAGYDPEHVYLLRHQDNRLERGELFRAWHSNRRNFDSYQEIQKWRNRFRKRTSIASFVVGPNSETLFIGLYHVTELKRDRRPYNDPLLGQMPEEDRAWHKFEHSRALQEFEAKLVIDWGAGFLAWRQRARRHNKKILEIRTEIKDEPFPQYLSFSRRLGELTNIYSTWQSRLEERKGIYLLTFEDGSLYVGSATGAQGFWQRWKNYLANGHGGNRVLIRDKRDARKAMISILEIAGSGDTEQDIVNKEMIWQRKLGMKAKRLE